MSSFFFENGNAYAYDSPVEFILVATIGKKRGVIAKSKGAQIDLASYAQNNRNKENLRGAPAILQVFFPTLQELRPLTADSKPLNNLKSIDYDDRLSEFTLVWRGENTNGLIDRIEVHLNDLGPSIIEALEEADKPSIEWLLSPLIAECNAAIQSKKRTRLINAANFKVLTWTVIFYLAGGFFIYLYPYLKETLAEAHPPAVTMPSR